MSISTAGKAASLGLALGLALSSATASAQMRQEDPDAVDVARTPLEDFNIKSEDIPQILVDAVRDPYDTTGITSCSHVVAQLAVLDNVLGPDFDIPQEERARISAGRVAKSVVGSLIPFRGIVREVSGANKKRNERQLAYVAGMVRRGYLKGMGEARGCSYPARPRPAVGEVDAAVSSSTKSGVSTPIPPNIERNVPTADVPIGNVPTADPQGPLPVQLKQSGEDAPPIDQ